jgi:hypothetical protein
MVRTDRGRKKGGDEEKERQAILEEKNPLTIAYERKEAPGITKKFVEDKT